MIIFFATSKYVKMAACAFAGAAPFVAMLPPESLSLVQKYGFGAFFAIASGLLYQLWKEASKKVESKNKEIIDSLRQQLADRQKVIDEQNQKLDKYRNED